MTLIIIQKLFESKRGYLTDDTFFLKIENPTIGDKLRYLTDDTIFVSTIDIIILVAKGNI